MTDRTYLKRRAAQEIDLAGRATDRRAAAAHDVMALAYLRQIAGLAEPDLSQLRLKRPHQL